MRISKTGHDSIKLIQTEDLDLRCARFVQYSAIIGGPGERSRNQSTHYSPECMSPTQHTDDVILDYSIDNGLYVYRVLVNYFQ